MNLQYGDIAALTSDTVPTHLSFVSGDGLLDDGITMGALGPGGWRRGRVQRATVCVMGEMPKPTTGGDGGWPL